LSKALDLAQWDMRAGAYVPLRNAYRLANAADILAVRDPASPAVAEARRKVNAFLAGLTPEQTAWFRAF
jgi:hypothetical protein